MQSFHKRKVLIAPIAVLALFGTACNSKKTPKTAASSTPVASATSSSSDTSSASASTSSSDTASASASDTASASAPAAGPDKMEGNRIIAGDNPNGVNTGKVSAGGTLTYTLEKTIDNWNILTSAGNTFETAEVLNSIYPNVFNVNPDLQPALNTDLMVSAEQTSASPQTLVYKIKPEAVWSDGTPINADDFIYFWKAQNGVDCKKCDINSTTGYAAIDKVEGTDSGKTVTVTMKTPYSDWKAMFSNLLPAHAATPAGLDAVSLEKSFDTGFAALPKISGGPFVISDFQKDQSVTLLPNDKWYGAVKPSLEKLVFRMITDATQEPPALENKEVDAMYPQPQVDLIKQLDAMQGVHYQMDLGLVFEHIDLNLQNPALQDVAVRKALFTAVDTKGMIARTAGQIEKSIEPLGNRMFVPQQKGYVDNVTSYGYGSGDADKATKYLTDAGYKIEGGKLIDKAGKPFPELSMRYTEGNAIRQSECELFAAAAKKLGITVKVSPTDSLGGTLAQKDAQHKFDVIVFAWVANPFGSSNAVIYQTNTAQGGDSWGSNYGHYKNDAVDKLLAESVTTTDPARQIEVLNQADKQISEDAATLPLYQKPVILAYQDKWANIRDNATSLGPPYNTQEWGQRAAS
ncbi:MAG: glutathione transport system substrate-binding protein [Frankiaceae bacterium]|nr:glutathione transport system substrate-binding protein [Frankiaceae bacterium]